MKNEENIKKEDVIKMLKEMRSRQQNAKALSLVMSPSYG